MKQIRHMVALFSCALVGLAFAQTSTNYQGLAFTTPYPATSISIG
jgi:hypothetical protein